MGKRLKFGTKKLAKLSAGDIVAIQNQTGNRAKKWDKTGLVVEALPYDQYRVKADGSGIVTLRNRQYLRKIGTDDSVNSAPPTQPLPCQDATVSCGFVQYGSMGEQGRGGS